MEQETFLDCDDAWLIALTRQRRSEARHRRLKTLPEPIRFSNSPPEYACEEWVAEAAAFGMPIRMLAAPFDEERAAWRDDQWRTGDRRCGYCRVPMNLIHNHPAEVSVDHRQALGRRGLDVESNWILCCRHCNGRKGLMSETSFRALLAAEASRLTTPSSCPMLRPS